LKFKLILVTILAFGSMAHAQGFVSNLSIGLGFQGVFPSATFTRGAAEVSSTNATTQDTTKSVGATADARYDFGRHSALGFAFTINRASEVFESSVQNFSRVKSNDSEFIGTYIFRLPSNPHVKPYAMFGGGLVRFSPVTNEFTTGGTPQTESKPAFAFGFGSDFRISDHFGLRLQYRGLLRGDPDFKLPVDPSTGLKPFGTGPKTMVSEPSIQVVYHF
jgi:opacity protein-like surface antigen